MFKCVCVCVLLFCSHKLKMAVKLRAEYTPVLHMPVLKEGKSKVAPNALDLYDSSGYTSAGECEYPYITNTQRDLTVFEAIVRCV